MVFEVLKCIKIQLLIVIYFLLLVVFFLQNIDELTLILRIILN